jgi:tetratricopeptide (TPR) repeat protein
MNSLNLDYKNISSTSEKLSKENLELKNKYVTLQKDYEAISLDRNNLILQAKNLLAGKTRANELENSIEKIKQEYASLEKENAELRKQNLGVKAQFKKLTLSYETAVKDKKSLEEQLAKERDISPINKLEEGMTNLQKAYDNLSGAVQEKEKEIDKSIAKNSKTQEALDKTKDELNFTREKLDKLTKNYADAVKKNRLLEQKNIELPGKFTEIARQNKALIKETANMHYNLGVFYTKNKEYTRAIAEFEKAIELTPDDAYAHFNLGYIYAEYLSNRNKAIEQFRKFLRLAKNDDKDVDWVKKYIITWEAYDGKKPME